MLFEPLRQLVESCRVLHEQDIANGEASVCCTSKNPTRDRSRKAFQATIAVDAYALLVRFYREAGRYAPRVEMVERLASFRIPTGRLFCANGCFNVFLY